MQEPEETFNISVEINKGLEPLTLTIVAYKQAALNATQELSFNTGQISVELILKSSDPPFSGRKTITSFILFQSLDILNK